MRMSAVSVPIPLRRHGPKAGKKAALRGSESEPPHSELRAFVPGGQVVFLLGNDIHLRLQVLVVRAQVFGRKRLIGEAHVHYGSGMAFGRGKIDEAAFGE